MHVVVFALTGHGSHIPIRANTDTLHVRLVPSVDSKEVNAVALEPKRFSEASPGRVILAPVVPNLPAENQRPNWLLLPEINQDKRYYLPDEVDVRAQPTFIEALIYPKMAYQLRISGRVRLKVFINESGEIDSIDVVEANPPNVFEEAALQAMLATHFDPAEKDGHPVKSQKLIEINFDPYEKTGQTDSSLDSDKPASDNANSPLRLPLSNTPK